MDKDRPQQHPLASNQNYEDTISAQFSMLKEIEALHLTNLAEKNKEEFLIIELSYQLREMRTKVLTLGKFASDMRRSIESKGQPDQGSEPAQFFIETVKVIEREQNNASRVANKLKVLCSKALLLQKPSTKMNYIHLHPPFIERIKAHESEALVFDQNKDKIYNQLQKIKKKFKITYPQFIGFYRHHRTALLSSILGQFVFYINFYHEGLLFLEGQPLKFNSNILFCPILLEQQPANKDNKIELMVSISDVYLEELKQENASWQHYCFYLIFREQQRAKDGGGIPSQNIVKIQACKEEKHIGEDERDWVAVLLKKIRGYVYLKIIWNWITSVVEKHTFERNRNAINLDLGGGVSFQLTTVNPKHIIKDPKSQSIHHDRGAMERKKSHDRMGRRDSIRDNDLLKREDQFQKMIAREFLNFFSPSRMDKIIKNSRSREELGLHFKLMVKHIYQKACRKSPVMGEYQGFYKYYYDGYKREEI